MKRNKLKISFIFVTSIFIIACGFLGMKADAASKPKVTAIKSISASGTKAGGNKAGLFL